MTTPFFLLCLLWGPFGSSRSLDKILTFGPATPTGCPNPAKPLLLLGNDPKSFCKFFQNFYDFHSAAFFARFSKILASIQGFLKKHVSLLLSCRGGLGEGPAASPPKMSLQSGGLGFAQTAAARSKL